MPIYDAKYYSPNYGYPKGSKGRRGYAINGIGVHITGGEWQSNYNWVTNPKSNASYNCIVQRDGSKILLVEESDAAYSHGKIDNSKKAWPLLKPGVNPNLHTLSISRVGSNQNIWEPPQMESIEEMIRYYSKKYGFPLQYPHVFSHKDIDNVERWYCPGEPFINELYKRLSKTVHPVQPIQPKPVEPKPVTPVEPKPRPKLNPRIQRIKEWIRIGKR